MSEKNSQISAKLPPLNTLRVFEVAARHKSFVLAAQELHVTHGAVSRQVKQLEAQLEAALFERRNRSVFLTPQGHLLYEVCHRIMQTLADAVREIKQPDADKQPLVLSCEPTIAIRWLIPRLASFRQRYPDFQLHLMTAGGHVDFAHDRIDVALRRNDFNWGAQCHAESVAPEITGPVCAQKLAHEFGPALAHLPSMRLLKSRTRPLAWQRWKEVTGKEIQLGAEEAFEHFYLSLQAASAGLGVAVGSIYMVEDDLRDGRLHAPFGFVPDGSEYVLLSPVPFQKDKRRLVLLDWMRYEMAKSRQAVDGIKTD
jgi:DNA-binding transcriptional LysR family regulator